MTTGKIPSDEEALLSLEFLMVAQVAKWVRSELVSGKTCTLPLHENIVALYCPDVANIAAKKPK